MWNLDNIISANDTTIEKDRIYLKYESHPLSSDLTLEATLQAIKLANLLITDDAQSPTILSTFVDINSVTDDIRSVIDLSLSNDLETVSRYIQIPRERL